MKKIISTLAMVSSLAVVANADFARIEMGVGAWQQDSKGYIKRTDSDGPLSLNGAYESAEKDATQGYAWALVKHPIPIIPNIRLEYVSVSDEGSVTGVVNAQSIPGSASTKIDMNQYDVIPYYNLLDNTFWITLDAGVDIKFMETKATVDNIGTFSGYEDTETTVLPLVYLRGRVQIPTTGLGVEADAKVITYSDTTLYDARIKVDYTFDITPIIQPGLEVGYRMQKLRVDDGTKTQIDLEYSGVYAGLMLRF